MSKSGMIEVNPKGLKAFFQSRQKAARDIAQLTNMSEAGVFKWLRTGKLPAKTLKKIVVRSCFGDLHELEENPDIGLLAIQRRPDFKIKKCFADSIDVFVSVIIDGLEDTDDKLYSSVPHATIVYFENGDIEERENDMFSNLKVLHSPGFESTNKIELANVPLEDLVTEISRRGWNIQLQNAKFTNQVKKKTRLKKK